MSLFGFGKKSKQGAASTPELGKSSITSPDFGGVLSGKTASQIADHIFVEQARLARSTGKDSTAILAELLIKYSLHWATVEFNDFEKSKAFLGNFMNESLFPQDIIIAGISATFDGAFMVLGGDYRNYESRWIDTLDEMSRNKKRLGINQVTFVTY